MVATARPNQTEDGSRGVLSRGPVNSMRREPTHGTMPDEPRLPLARPPEPLSRRRLLLALASAASLPLLDPAALLAGRVSAAAGQTPATDNNWEGPFYKPGAPARSVLLEPGMPGTPLAVTGRVLDTRGRPLRGALLDVWHADNAGNYDNAGFRLRGRLYTDDEGRYALRTVKPMYYGAPGDMRPAHIHVKASAGSSPVLTTQLYFKGDPWIAADPEVRPPLVLSPREASGGLAATFDFVLDVG